MAQRLLPIAKPYHGTTVSGCCQPFEQFGSFGEFSLSDNANASALSRDEALGLAATCGGDTRMERIAIVKLSESHRLVAAHLDVSAVARTGVAATTSAGNNTAIGSIDWSASTTPRKWWNRLDGAAPVDAGACNELVTVARADDQVTTERVPEAGDVVLDRVLGGGRR